jgi:hypothetical protein
MDDRRIVVRSPATGTTDSNLYKASSAALWTTQSTIKWRPGVIFEG